MTTLKKNWNKQESSYRDVMKQAFDSVNAMIIKKTIEIKDLATFDSKADYKEKLPYSAKKGSELFYGDLATGEGENRKSLKDSKGNPINPYHVGDGEDKDIKKVADNIDANLEKYKGKIDVDKFKASQAYKELINPSIDLAAYYMSNQGYDRAFYKKLCRLPPVFSRSRPRLIRKR